MKYAWTIEVAQWSASGWDYTQTYESGTEVFNEESEIWDLDDFKEWYWDASGNNIEMIEDQLEYHEYNNMDYKWTFTAKNTKGEKIIELEFWENELMKELIAKYTEEA